jgi:hypothetical protein
MSKQENVQAVLSRFTPEELSLIFRAAASLTEPKSYFHNSGAVSEIRQENLKHKLCIASIDLEVAAYTG